MSGLSKISFRAFLESPRYCGLELSPVIAALADSMDGRRPTSIDDALSTRIFGCVRDLLPAQRRRIFGLVAGGQGGKSSRLGAPRLLHLAWTVPLPNLRPGQKARGPIFAPDRDLAMAALDYCKGYIMGSPVLREALVLPEKGRKKLDEDEEDEWEDWPGAQEKIRLRRPDGAIVEIAIKAATKGGTGARSRTLFGVLLDEACFFGDEAAVVNDKDILDAALQRIVPGGQAVLASTPWDEDIGELMRLCRENIGKHEEALVAGGSADHHVTTRDLFPGWDPTNEIEPGILRDPARHSREVLGIPLPSGSSRWFSPDAVALSLSLSPFGDSPIGRGAGADFAFERDDSSLSIVDRFEGDRLDLRAQRTWTPPLKPSAVCRDVADELARHGLRELEADAHSRASVREHLDDRSVSFIDAPGGNEGKWITYTRTRDLMVEGKLRLAGAPNVPRLRQQLAAVLKRPLPGGRWQIYVPRRKGQGHGDDVSSLVLGVDRALKSGGFEDVRGFAEVNATMTNPRRIEPETYVDPGRDETDIWTNPRYC